MISIKCPRCGSSHITSRTIKVTNLYWNIGEGTQAYRCICNDCQKRFKVRINFYIRDPKVEIREEVIM